MNFIAKATLAAALVLGAAQADAAVIYTFNQVGPFQQPPAPFGVSGSINGQLIVSDTAAQSGFNYQLQNYTYTPYSQSSLAGLLSLVVEGIGLPNQPPIADITTLDTLTTPRQQEQFSYVSDFSLTGSDTTGLYGVLNFRNLEEQVHYVFSGTTFTARFGADYTGGCPSPLCTFSGNITTTTVPVPEPASLALFGIGLAGLGLIRRKRAA